MLVQYALALLISAPPTDGHEMTFAFYYILLLGISGVILIHYHTVKQLMA